MLVGAVGASSASTRANVTVTFDGHGRGFVCGWVGDRQHPGTGGALVWRSDDDGRTFLPPVTAAPGFLDHPTLGADKAAGLTESTLYLAGYLAASPGGLVFCRSTDGGRTFEQLRFIDPQSGSQGRLPLMGVGPRGMVVIVYFVAMPDGSNRLEVVTSHDHGQTFRTPVDLAPVNFDLSSGNITRGGPAVAVAPGGGRVYTAAVTYDAATRRSELLLFSSKDRGDTWSRPISVVYSSRVHYMQPQLTVADDGRVGLSVLELSNSRVNVLLFISDRQSTRFGKPLTVTTKSFDPSLGTIQGTSGLGDYQGLASTPGAFHPFWNDTRTGQLEIFTATVSPAD
jgi:hypothetical protein